jgi:hypothetical protein
MRWAILIFGSLVFAALGRAEDEADGEDPNIFSARVMNTF